MTNVPVGAVREYGTPLGAALRPIPFLAVLPVFGFGIVSRVASIKEALKLPNKIGTIVPGSSLGCIRTLGLLVGIAADFDRVHSRNRDVEIVSFSLVS